MVDPGFYTTRWDVNPLDIGDLVDRDSADGAYLGLGQAARILSISPKTLNRWAAGGRVACAIQLGGQRRFLADLIADLASPPMGLEPPDSPETPPDPRSL